MFPTATRVPFPTAHVEAAHTVYWSVASSTPFHVPAVHSAQVPVAAADPDPAGHTADILNAIMLLMKKRVCVFIKLI